MKYVDVSVLITNFNHGRFLPECLDAVFSQSALPKEVIVIDDVSTDESLSIIREYQKKQPTLIFLQNAKNQGPAKTMTTAIRHAKSKYLVLAAADDQILPGFLEEGTFYLDRYPEVGICCSTPSFFKDERPYRFWKTLISNKKQVTLMPAETIHKLYLRSSLWIPTHASLYRRDLVLQYGCLEDGLKHICDWYLNCKIAMTHGIVFVPSSFGAFRVSSQSYGATWGRSYRKKISVYKQLFAMLSQEPSNYQKIFRKSGVLGLITADVLFYLLANVSLWKYLPYACYRKLSNFLRKIKHKLLPSQLSRLHGQSAKS